jgi:hypothetical protein
MSHAYGDAIVYVQKQPDGTVRLTNAIVLASTNQAPTDINRRAIKGAAFEEHIDLAFPVRLAPGTLLKTRAADEIFRPAFSVKQFTPDAWTGFIEPEEAEACGAYFAPKPSAPEVEEGASSGDGPVASGQPSAADLDAAAAEAALAAGQPAPEGSGVETNEAQQS